MDCGDKKFRTLRISPDSTRRIFVVLGRKEEDTKTFAISEFVLENKGYLLFYVGRRRIRKVSRPQNSSSQIIYFRVLTTNRGETNISTSESTRKISGVSFLRQRRNPRSLFESKNTTGNLPYFLMLLYSNGKKMGKEEIFTAASGIISTLRPEITAGYRLFMKIGGFREVPL